MTKEREILIGFEITRVQKLVTKRFGREVSLEAIREVVRDAEKEAIRRILHTTFPRIHPIKYKTILDVINKIETSEEFRAEVDLYVKKIESHGGKLVNPEPGLPKEEFGMGDGPGYAKYDDI